MAEPAASIGDHALAGRIATEARATFEDFVRKRVTWQPTLLPRVLARQAWLVRWLRPLALLPLSLGRIRGRRYLFLSGRFDALAAQFDRDEAAIIGAQGDLRTALRIGLPWRFTGDLFIASHDILLGRGGPGALRVVGRWLRFLRRQHSQCVLVVPNDTLPIATLLVTIARHCPNVTVACVQHGLFSEAARLDDIDGRISHVNLVYDAGQRKEMERRLPAAVAEVMGLPAGHHATDGDAGPPVAILVGNGATEVAGRYQRTLELFAQAAAALERAGFRVRYRAHPSEGAAADAAARFALDRTSKQALLGGERLVFVGFFSTLLYEAEAAGHAVFVVEDALVPGYTLSPIGSRLGAGALGDLEALAPAALQRLRSRPVDDAGPRARFEAALVRALARLRGN